MTLLQLIQSIWPKPRPVRPTPVPPRPAPVPTPAPVPPSPAPAPGDVATSLLDAHNGVRAARRRPPLTSNPMLVAAARQHASLMASRERMDHRLPGERDPWQRIADAGYRASREAENVAAGQRDVQAVMAAWVKSSGHLENIVGPCTEMGGSVAVGADGTPFWSVSFASPAGAFGVDGGRMETTTFYGQNRATSGIRHAPEGEQWWEELP